MNTEVPQKEPLFDSQRLRRALGHFATGVTIITTRAASGDPIGMACNSFASVSLEPPLVQWAIAKTSRNYDAICSAAHFAVHVLDAGQRDLCRQFSAKDQDRFAGTEMEIGLHNLPLIKAYHARFECATYAWHEAGDHTIIIGRVLRLDEQAGDPLIFYRGGYARLVAD